MTNLLYFTMYIIIDQLIYYELKNLSDCYVLIAIYTCSSSVYSYVNLNSRLFMTVLSHVRPHLSYMAYIQLKIWSSNQNWISVLSVNC